MEEKEEQGVEEEEEQKEEAEEEQNKEEEEEVEEEEEKEEVVEEEEEEEEKEEGEQEEDDDEDQEEEEEDEEEVSIYTPESQQENGGVQDNTEATKVTETNDIEFVGAAQDKEISTTEADHGDVYWEEAATDMTSSPSSLTLSLTSAPVLPDKKVERDGESVRPEVPDSTAGNSQELFSEDPLHVDGNVGGSTSIEMDDVSEERNSVTSLQHDVLVEQDVSLQQATLTADTPNVKGTCGKTCETPVGVPDDLPPDPTYVAELVSKLANPSVLQTMEHKDIHPVLKACAQFISSYSDMSS